MDILMNIYEKIYDLKKMSHLLYLKSRIIKILCFLEKRRNILVSLKIQELENSGIYNILIFCTGHFEKVKTKGCIIIPENIICGLLLGLGISRVGIIVPEEEQISDSLKQYSDFNPIIRAASLYKDMDNISKVAEEFREKKC